MYKLCYEKRVWLAKQKLKGKMEHITEESVGAFLHNYNNNKFLLILRDDSKIWEFPKGHTENLESHDETLKRELKEETGINLTRMTKRIGTVEYALQKSDIVKTRIIHYYLVQTNEKKVKLSKEHTQAVWVAQREAVKLLPFDNTRKLLSTIQVNELSDQEGKDKH
jgi:bis(5'-nucleosidyl)-tetraphosphatase